MWLNTVFECTLESLNDGSHTTPIGMGSAATLESLNDGSHTTPIGMGSAATLESLNDGQPYHTDRNG